MFSIASLNSKKIFHNKDTIDADYDSFEILVTWNDLSKDKNHVWFYDNNEDVVKEIYGVDPNTFDFDNHAQEHYK